MRSFIGGLRPQAVRTECVEACAGSERAWLLRGKKLAAVGSCPHVGTAPDSAVTFCYRPKSNQKGNPLALPRGAFR